jgi:hypothetical protein
LVKATSAEEASEIAKMVILNDLAPYSLKNPPDLLMQLTIEEVSELTWFQWIRNPTRSAFAFYNDDLN